ncbi:MAG: HAMP domain-containing histidine kinase [Hydrococcus sp. C42_A2020_068]|uniref:sensor histidine kinase n=1 Tax=Pleurocapsa sp. PCC 7327 TaxID=118163 RepID=UPI00029FF041|nr:HAMP domain-containing sensor histidine kinase [Pleurocapsa sp. PCC 7327]AFY77590.1 signal transduction histidine kinase [Pleurocapsa sp. PCC 7327]MBF2019175.1 HAMP domain-containing histidine kinase [Hydrococcus sp. C42_A2020_068]
MFQTTRRRLALWYTAVTAILLLLFATGVYFYVRSTLIERIDDTLKHVVEVVSRSLVIQSLPAAEGRYRINLEASFRHNADEVEDDRIDLEWFDSQGKLLWSTFSEPLDIPLHPNRSGETVHFDRDRLLRQVTERIEINHHVLGYLRVSHPWFEVTKPIRQLAVDLTIGIGMTILCVAAIGWLLSGIAIKPVRDSYQSLKQFTADASHELRNPIATIQTNVQMALAYPDAEPQLQQRQLRVIERLTQRLGNLVNDLLFLARSDSGMVKLDYQAVPLDALLIEVIEEQRIIAQQKGIFLSLHIVEPPSEFDRADEEIFTLKGDWDQLARLFTNLIGNSLEHGFEKPGVIEVGLGLSKNSKDLPTVNVENTPIQESEAKIQNPKETSVEVELQRIKRDRHAYLQVKVKDTGKGIPEADLPHIFDRFYRVDPSRSHPQQTSASTGLGLAIARAIVENHHGHIAVESACDRGTTFTVTLPINPQP